MLPAREAWRFHKPTKSAVMLNMLIGGIVIVYGWGLSHMISSPVPTSGSNVASSCTHPGSSIDNLTLWHPMVIYYRRLHSAAAATSL